MTIQPCKDGLPWWAPGSESRKTTWTRLASDKGHLFSWLSCFQRSYLKTEIDKHTRKKGMGWWNSQGGQAHLCAHYHCSEGDQVLPVSRVITKIRRVMLNCAFIHTQIYTFFGTDVPALVWTEQEWRRSVKGNIFPTPQEPARTKLNQLLLLQTATPWLGWHVHKQCGKHLAGTATYRVCWPQAALLLPCSEGAAPVSLPWGRGTAQLSWQLFCSWNHTLKLHRPLCRLRSSSTHPPPGMADLSEPRSVDELLCLPISVHPCMFW